MPVGVVRGIVDSVHKVGIMGWASKRQYVGMKYRTDCQSGGWKCEKRTYFAHWMTVQVNIRYQHVRVSTL